VILEIPASVPDTAKVAMERQEEENSLKTGDNR
jgi:hypothetical protein